MKQYVLAFLIGALVTISNAQVLEMEKTVVCSKPDMVFKELAKEYQERIYWAGHGEKSGSTYILWINAKNNTWTLTQSTREISCIIGSGTENRLLLGSNL